MEQMALPTAALVAAALLPTTASHPVLAVLAALVQSSSSPTANL